MTELCFDRLIEDIGSPVVYDPVPDSERERAYKYWRGLSLARLALELSMGNKTLSLGGNPVHFIDYRNYAVNVAKDIARGASLNQTQPDDCVKIEHALGVSFTSKTPHPSLVVAHRELNPVTFASSKGDCHGVVIPGYLSDLDTYSQEFIKDYFKIPTLETGARGSIRNILSRRK